tara:strand:+ start:239 stop:781 length:543 start_codon:yes stop_codon:yes gene_type:complete
MNSIKRSNDDLKANRPTLEEVRFIPKVPISILVEDVRSVHNVGSIFRTADSFGAEKIYLSGITAYPPRADLHKTALGAEESVDWEYVEDPVLLAKKIKGMGITLVVIEQTKKSQNIFNTDLTFPVCFIVGNEVDGVSEELSELSDIHLEIPMNGIKQSLNVSVATGIIGYELRRKFKLNN